MLFLRLPAVLLSALASLLIAGFGAYAHLRYIVELAAVIGLVGIGQTIAVIGGGIDLSVSAVITVTAIILPLVTFDSDPTGLGAIALALLVAAGIGAVNGLGIGYLGLPPLIMTLAMATILQGLLILIAGGYSTDQTAPAFGLFGSIIGYILGSANRGTPGTGNTPATGSTPSSGNTVAPAETKTP